MPKYITCITRVLLNTRRILMSSCPGEPSLYDTHCQYCDYWVENQPELEEDEDDGFSREIYEDEDDKEEQQ